MARFLLPLAALALGACRFADDAVDGTVVVLVLDGVRLEESLGDDPSGATGELPAEFWPRVWSELLPQGVRLTQAWSLGATTTAPAHVAISSGRRQAFANYAIPDDAGLYLPELPSVFDAVMGEGGADPEEVVLVANTDQVLPIERSLWPGSEAASFVWVYEDGDPEKPSGDDAVVAQALKGWLEDHPTRFALANLHQVDRSGHYGGAESYLDDVRALDGTVVGLWDWIQESSNYRDDTWLVVLSDHGRHSYSEDEPFWRHHGCNCNGCRRVPILVLGPDVAAGETSTEPFLLADLAPTLAARLGLDLPFADGLVRDDLFETGSGVASRAGIADYAVAGGLVAELRHQDDPATRAALWVEGQQLSDPAALDVEAPALAAQGDDAWACFRELHLTPDEPDTAWRPRCLASRDGGASWAEQPAPYEAVGPHWQPVLLPWGTDTLLGAWVDNLNGSSTAGVEGAATEVSLDIGRYADGAWTLVPDDGAQTFPTDLALARVEDRLVVAVGSGPTGNEARHTRDVFLGRVDISGAAPAWAATSSAGLSSLAAEGDRWRLERPALRAVGTSLWLAAVGQDEGGGRAVLASSDDLGATFGEAWVVDLGLPPDPHTSPVWLGERAVWVGLDLAADEARLCSASHDLDARCVSVGAARIQRLAVDGERLYGLVDRDAGTWTLESWEAGEI